MQHKYLMIWTIIEFCRVFNLRAVISGMHGMFTTRGTNASRTILNFFLHFKLLRSNLFLTYILLKYLLQLFKIRNSFWLSIFIYTSLQKRRVAHIVCSVFRCITMQDTKDLFPGTECTWLEGPIAVPVGEGVLGRLMNVLADAEDQRGPIPRKRWSVHQYPPLIEDLVRF